MVLDESVKMCLLNDFYGTLLTANQQQVLDNYLNYNMPLIEISKNLGVTRQAVLDTIKKASAKLLEFEEKLGMLKKYLAQQQIAKQFGQNSEISKKMLEVWKQEWYGFIF